MKAKALFRFLLPLLLAACAPGLLSAAPDWVEQLVKQPATSQIPKVGAEVLLDETVREVRNDGTLRETRRFAVRILKQTSAHVARVSERTSFKEDKFSEGSAWLFRNGKHQRLPYPPDWVTTNDLGDGVAKSEALIHTLSYASQIEEGDIFAATWSTTTTPLLATMLTYWSAARPVRRDAFEYRLPEGWTLQVEKGNTEGLTVESSGAAGVWRWSRSTPQPLAEEPDAAESDIVNSWLRVRLTPPRPFPGKWLTFADWETCGSWMHTLAAPQLDSNPDLEARARDLCASAGGDKLAELRAIASFVQHLPYVAVAVGLGKGLGFQPRKATEVLHRQLGDCKDKANLFRALCSARGFKTFNVATLAGSDTWFDPLWASPSQFDHAIAAVQWDEPFAGAAAQKNETFGNLIFFDATSQDTYFGDLPSYLHGKPALILGDGRAAQVQLPKPSDEARDATRMTVVLTLATSGAVEGTLSIETTAKAAQSARYWGRSLSQEKLTRNMTAQLSRTLKGIEITNLTLRDYPDTNRHQTDVAFLSAGATQPLPDGKMVLKLGAFGEDAVPAFPASTRERRLKRDPSFSREVIELRLPPGFAVEDLPRGVVINGDYGTSTTEWKVEGNVVRVTREVLWRAIDLTPAQYAGFKAHLAKVARAWNSSILLRRAD
ncbi:hypothetical protein [Nibricoccus sp. IMCC34717]|uniref:hypothetical protein n=1 Tax=Nibricoccus sp. IMCC34717 TaxID=3034021 RepID=UPI00384BCC60